MLCFLNCMIPCTKDYESLYLLAVALMVRYHRQELLSHYFYFQINSCDWWWHKFGFHNLPKIVVSVLVFKNPYQTTDTDWCWCAGQTEGRRRAWEETTGSEKHRKKRKIWREWVIRGEGKDKMEEDGESGVGGGWSWKGLVYHNYPVK